MHGDFIDESGNYVNYNSDRKPSLIELQTLVGGYIRIVYLPNGDQMIVDDDGISKGKTTNIYASIVASTVIVGDVVILSGKGKMK